MKNQIIFLAIISLLSSCTTLKLNSTKKNKYDTDYTQFVNPFIGTSKMGHVYPGATVPFGMVQLSPQTNFEPLFNVTNKLNQPRYP